MTNSIEAFSPLLAGIPHTAVNITHVDEMCPLVKKDLRAIYKSWSVKEKVSLKKKV